MAMSEIKAYRTLVVAFREGLGEKQKEALREHVLIDLDPICCGARADRYGDEGGS